MANPSRTFSCLPTFSNSLTFYNVSDVVGRQRLRSASRLQVVIPRHRLTTLGRRAFAVMGPTVWNSLPDDLRAQQISDFSPVLKDFFSLNTSVHSALDMSTRMRYIIHYTKFIEATNANYANSICKQAHALHLLHRYSRLRDSTPNLWANDSYKHVNWQKKQF